MARTELLQETRKMRFGEVSADWNRGRLTQYEAALTLGMSERDFRRHVCRFEAEGEAGLEDKRSQACLAQSAPFDEVLEAQNRYEKRYRVGRFATSMAGIGVKAASAATVE